ncbi:MAG: DeoR/GlpR transcriptional regulator [Clostridia bacterium]|nr:DeoR/GlpR transcriptional regulator [Clostridia bacterium]
MLKYERQQLLLNYLEQNPAATVKELAKSIYASEATVRRDLAALETAGLVQLVYGGVLLSKYKNEVVPAEVRESANSALKEKIAAQAATLIQDGDTVFFDSSSTVRRMCKHIKKRKKLKIITNNLRICHEFKDSEVTVYCTGGEFYKQRDCFLGPSAERFLRTIQADSLFFSCKGLSAEGVLTDASEEEVSMRLAMIEQSKKQYCLCDSTKLGVENAFVICRKEEITDLICDQPLQ